MTLLRVAQEPRAQGAEEQLGEPGVGRVVQQVGALGRAGWDAALEAGPLVPAHGTRGLGIDAPRGLRRALVTEEPRDEGPREPVNARVRRAPRRGATHGIDGALDGLADAARIEGLEGAHQVQGPAGVEVEARACGGGAAATA